MANQGRRQGQKGTDRQQNRQGGAAGQPGEGIGKSGQQNQEGQNQSGRKGEDRGGTQGQQPS
jgi:hypothetical protein